MLDKTRGGGDDDTHPPPVSSEVGLSIPTTSGINPFGLYGPCTQTSGGSA